MSEHSNLEGKKIDLKDEVAVRSSLSHYSRWIDKENINFTMRDFNEALVELRKPPIKGLINHMGSIHKACKDFSKAVVTHNIEVRDGFDVPSMQRYYLGVGSYPDTAENNDLNTPLRKIKEKARGFVPLLENMGLVVRERAYSPGIYGMNPNNHASIRMEKSGFKEVPVLYFQPQYMNIGEMLHEAVAWFYITDGFDRSKFPISNQALVKLKSEKLGKPFLLTQAVLENPDLLYNIL